MDAGVDPLYAFGHGLSYSHFTYGGIRLSKNEIRHNESINIKVDITNDGAMEAVEIVQMYVRDRFGSVTRPVRELKGFQRISLKAGETRTVTFDLHTHQLSFYNKEMKYVTESGDFDLWIGGDSNATNHAYFKLIS